MFIPINTDAPLYHFPYATIGLIVINTVCFVATGCAMNERLLDPWLLEYGNGINPLEWIPAAFAHGGFMHLIGNMFFLWGFGLVVEGKLGWRVFLPLYFAMAAGWGAGVDLLTVHRTDAYVVKHEFELESINDLKRQVRDSLSRDFQQDVEQAVDALLDGQPLPEKEAPQEEEKNENATEETFDPEVEQLTRELLNVVKGRCLGASGVIFALIGISLVWAPKNEMTVVGFLGLRPFSVDVTVMFFALGYLVLQLIEFAIFPGMGSPGLHLVGIAIGFPIGVLWLKKNWVDCEKWDLFAVMSGKYGRFAEKDWSIGAHGNPNYLLKEIPVPEGSAEDGGETGSGKSAKRKRQLLKDINAFIDSGDCLSAAETLMTLRMDHSDLCPDAPRTKKLALGLLQAEAWDEAEIWLQEFIERFPEENAWARVRMAQLLVTQLERPQAALDQLKRLPTEGLSEQLISLAKKVSRTAKEQIKNGVVDRETEW